MPEQCVASQPIRFEMTDLDKEIELATTQRADRPATTRMVTTVREFFKLLSTPDQRMRSKEGPQFIGGPCPDRRRAGNLTKLHLVVVDADKSVTVEGAHVEGAPPPQQVHDALRGFGITHAIYTTHSHGSAKGNRYRIVVPAECTCPNQLKAVVMYVVDLLHVSAGIPLALSQESIVWGNGWYLPRVAYESAEFLFYDFHGYSPNSEDLSNHYGLHNLNTIRMAPPTSSWRRRALSPIALFCKAMSLHEHLEKAGYRFISQGVMVDHFGKDRTVMRYCSPGHDSSPGVVVYQDEEDQWRVYSFHASDPLNNGHSNDVFDVFKLLNGLEDDNQALVMACPELQEYIADELNILYPTIIEAGVKPRIGNTYVTELGAREIRLMAFSDLSVMLANSPGVPVVEVVSETEKTIKMVDRAEWWKRSPDRVCYNGAHYVPTPINHPTTNSVSFDGTPYYNLFRGWQIKPMKGNYPLLDWHLRYALCGGVEEEYRYLLDWFAHLFQTPSEKPGVAVILQGGRGWGKTILFGELARRMGSHAFVAGNNTLLTGRFNSHLRNRLLMVVEESFWSGNPRDRGVLQHIITDGVTGFEKKGIDAEMGASYLRVVMSTNEDWAFPVAIDERRAFLPSLTNVAKNEDIKDGRKGHYFPRLLNELRGGGLEAFVYDMANREFDQESVRNPPATPKLAEQRQRTLDWIDQWFLWALSAGEIRSRAGVESWSDLGCSIASDRLKESLLEALPGRQLGHSGHGVMTAFGARAQKVLTRSSFRKTKSGGAYRYLFGSLRDARLDFERYSGLKVDWDDIPAEAKNDREYGVKNGTSGG